MELKEFREFMASRQYIEGNSEVHEFSTLTRRKRAGLPLK